eukprot:1749724-Pleurochrysis_carterae.AAC.1
MRPRQARRRDAQADGVPWSCRRLRDRRMRWECWKRRLKAWQWHTDWLRPRWRQCQAQGGVIQLSAAATAARSDGGDDSRCEMGSSRQHVTALVRAACDGGEGGGDGFGDGAGEPLGEASREHEEVCADA